MRTRTKGTAMYVLAILTLTLVALTGIAWSVRAPKTQTLLVADIRPEAPAYEPIVYTETYEVPEGEFTGFRRDALECGYMVVRSAPVPGRKLLVTIGQTCETPEDAYEMSISGDFTHGRVA